MGVDIKTRSEEPEGQERNLLKDGWKRGIGYLLLGRLEIILGKA